MLRGHRGWRVRTVCSRVCTYNVIHRVTHTHTHTDAYCARGKLPHVRANKTPFWLGDWWGEISARDIAQECVEL